MEKKTAGIIGLIGGVVAAVGVFLPWMTVSFMGISMRESGWGVTVMFDSPYVALAGGILALSGALALLGGQKKIGFLLPLGGIIAIAGGAWGYSQVIGALEALAGVGVAGMPVGLEALFDISVGYGVYMCIVGGVLALISSLGLLKGK